MMQFLDYFKMRKKDRTSLALADREAILEEYEKLHTLCSYYEIAIENSQDTFGVTDGNGVMAVTNKAYEHLCGADRSEYLFKNIVDMAGELFDTSATAIALKTGKPVTVEQWLYRTNKHAHVTVTPVYDTDGKLIMTVSNDRDFDEIAALKEKLADTEDMVTKYRQQIAAIQAERDQPGHMVANDKNMLDVLYRADKIAKVDATVLVLGETGSGKEELVKYMHRASDRRDESLIKINCGALTASLIESELFGYEKGSFTGASSQGKYGFFEAADNGMIFLDEIGELPLEIQVKLLRVLQEREFYRIGGTRPIKTNVRIISATNRDLKDMVQNGQFRADLYYRLNVTSVTVPSLRERANDIIPLARKFLKEANAKYRMSKSISMTAYHALRNYDWPGNVRELRNVIEQAVIMSEGDTIRFDEFQLAHIGEIPTPFLGESIDLRKTMDKIELAYLNAAYETHGTVREAARSLGMSASTFARKRAALVNGL